MPITVGAIRKKRADARKETMNVAVRRAYKEAVLAMRKKPNEKNLAAVFSKVDRAVKNKVIHRNKASRLRSRLTALVKKK